MGDSHDPPRCGPVPIPARVPGGDGDLGGRTGDLWHGPPAARMRTPAGFRHRAADANRRAASGLVRDRTGRANRRCCGNRIGAAMAAAAAMSPARVREPLDALPLGQVEEVEEVTAHQHLPFPSGSALTAATSPARRSAASTPSAGPPAAAPEGSAGPSRSASASRRRRGRVRLLVSLATIRSSHGPNSPPGRNRDTGSGTGTGTPSQTPPARRGRPPLPPPAGKQPGVRRVYRATGTPSASRSPPRDRATASASSMALLTQPSSRNSTDRTYVNTPPAATRFPPRNAARMPARARRHNRPTDMRNRARQ